MILKSSRAQIIVSATFLCLSLGCSQHNKNSIAPAVEGVDIFSNRPIAENADLVLVTLKSPALLSEMRDDGSIPDDAKDTLLTEQSAFEARLKKEAPEAQIVYRYRLAVNGFAVFYPSSKLDLLQQLPGVMRASVSGTMSRLQTTTTTEAPAPLDSVTSVSFIGADQAHDQGVTGKGVRVGIIDTGADYTHKMLGGSGLPDDYKSIDPSRPNSAFPNKKIVGGIDLVGSGYNSQSPYSDGRLPKPDSNPLDEVGHGTHVAGTIAGIGDGSNTYSGVAPDAEIYAIKVFGASGSTSDAAVIAGLEYAADPNGDLNPDDHLDLVNLSLGGSFGSEHVLYSEAVKNVSRAGLMVVAAAGNEGAVPYIVSAPGTVAEALSVAASVDGSTKNWQFPAVKFVTSDGKELLATAVEGPISLPIAQTNVQGPLVDIGAADDKMTDAQKTAVKGKVALILRGGNNFLDKLERAQAAGAVGAVVYNNVPGEPIQMSAPPDTKPDIKIPAVMINQELGERFAKSIAAEGSVQIQFHVADKVKEPERVDAITSFSSAGPRLDDDFFKPEIAAPGANILSAQMGTGFAGVSMNGTSMATPHMSGVIALLRQRFPGMSVEDLKSAVMNSSKLLGGKNGVIAMTQQGAGRVQIMNALNTKITAVPAALSIGLVQLDAPTVVQRSIHLKNLTDAEITLSVVPQGSPGWRIEVPVSVTLPARGAADVPVEFKLSPDRQGAKGPEVDGFIDFKVGQQSYARVPAMAMRNIASVIQASGSPAAGFTLTNTGKSKGLALAFNLLGQDEPKGSPPAQEAFKGRTCDLQSAGYRILNKKNAKGETEDFLQFGFKLYAPVSIWLKCEVSVLIDADGDGIADQELAGVSKAGVEGVTLQQPFFSLLLDAPKARALRATYEQTLSQSESKKQDPPTLNYQTAALSISPSAPFQDSEVTVIEAPLKAVVKTKDGKFNVKLATISPSDENVESDDYLGSGLGQWFAISATAEEQPYYGMDEGTVVDSQATLSVKKGRDEGRLVLYYPHNKITATVDQAQIF